MTYPPQKAVIHTAYPQGKRDDSADLHLRSITPCEHGNEEVNR